jgi:hypothetical protein
MHHVMVLQTANSIYTVTRNQNDREVHARVHCLVGTFAGKVWTQTLDQYQTSDFGLDEHGWSTGEHGWIHTQEDEEIRITPVQTVQEFSVLTYTERFGRQDQVFAGPQHAVLVPDVGWNAE